MSWKTIETEILPFIDKPARYVGGEINSTVKTEPGLTRIALIYPDLYEIGISNIGIKILYDILNSHQEIACERAYAVWPDMEKALKDKGCRLYSLETKTPLDEFEVLGFSFQYELLYSNFLQVLELSGLPFYSHERAEHHPVIMGGGPVSGNLEPVAPFLDAICIGDGETVLPAMVLCVRQGRAAGKTRRAILDDLQKITGVYVPSLYTVTDKGGWLIPEGPQVKRSAVPDLNAIPFVTKQILPNLQAIQDRAVVEVSRGCTRGCRFCQAGITYRPVRERSVFEIVNLAREAVKNTGYRELSLISLSISDYSRLPQLIEALDAQLAPHGVSFSLPSLRLDSFTLDLAKKVREIRKSGLTFAVEGGTQAIRDAINKGVNEEELLQVIGIAKELGWKSVKLYFMIGLPGFDPAEERAGIEKLAERIKAAHKGFAITISIAVFIPKPHTPYQWDGQLGSDEGFTHIKALKDFFRGKKGNVTVRYNSTILSWLEGVFSRGDRRLAPAILRAYQNGARFDGWDDQLKIDLWKESFAAEGINTAFYLEKKEISSPLPWDYVTTGIDHDFLVCERELSTRQELTKDCRDGCVSSCGNCDFKTMQPHLAQDNPADAAVIDPSMLSRIIVKAEPKVLARIEYEKRGSFRFTTPADLEEQISRAMLRANLPAVFTRGFNPHIRVEMGWALATGVESESEYAEIEFSEAIAPEELQKAWNQAMPQGLQCLSVRIFPLPAAHLSKLAREQLVSFRIKAGLSEATVKEYFEKAKEFKKVTSKTEVLLNLHDFVRNFAVKDGDLEVTYLQKEGGARIQDIILGLTGLDVRQAVACGVLITARHCLVKGKEIPVREITIDQRP